MLPPALDDDPRFIQRVEDLTIQEFVPHPRIERLDVPVLPWASRRDVGRPGADRRNPLLDRLGDELRAVAHRELG